MARLTVGGGHASVEPRGLEEEIAHAYPTTRLSVIVRGRALNEVRDGLEARE